MNYCGCCCCHSFSSTMCTQFIPIWMYHHTKPLLAWIEKVIWTWCFFQCCCCNRYTHLTVRYLSAIAHQSKRCILENEDKWFEENVQPEMALLWKRVRCVLMCTWPTRSNRRRSVNELFMSPSGNTIRWQLLGNYLFKKLFTFVSVKFVICHKTTSTVFAAKNIHYE